MAFHQNKSGLIRETLTEYIEAAALCLNTQKNAGGVFGYSAALLLLSCVDALGGYYRGREGFMVVVDGRQQKIGNAASHFRILNSHLFNLGLTQKQISGVYDDYRCKLSHNAAIKSGVALAVSNGCDPLVFNVDGRVTVINLDRFFPIVAQAVGDFLDEGDDAIEQSRAGRNI